jgi:HPt (histidine-containing phosphotransfer) domain-containing protein
MTQPLVDAAHVDHLTTRWGGAFTARMISLFLTQSETRTAAIASGREAGDLRAIEQAAHSLKSSAGNLGAGPLMALCQEVETAAGQGDVSVVESRVPQLLSVATGTCEALAALRDRLPAPPTA